jgi:hypothetical protein
MHTFQTNFQARRNLEAENGRQLTEEMWLNSHTRSMRRNAEIIGKWKWLWMQAFTDYWG